MSAPQFKVEDVFGKKISLRDTANKYTLVVFLRYSGCPWCNLAIHRLALEQKILKDSRCEIIAFVQSNKQNIITNIYDRHKHRPEFSIIADQQKKFYDLYDVKSSVTQFVKTITKIPYWIHAVKEKGFKQTNIDGDLLMVPAMFLVNEGQQKIIYASYSADLYDDGAFTKVYEAITSDRIS